jgi:hypothetical protein
MIHKWKSVPVHGPFLIQNQQHRYSEQIRTFMVVASFHLTIRVFEVSKTTRIPERAVTLVHYS